MPTKARGASARVPDAPVVFEDFIVDDPGPNDVVVRILASGVCHTDLGLKTGTYGTDGFPFLLGHEGAGVVEEVGTAPPCQDLSVHRQPAPHSTRPPDDSLPCGPTMRRGNPRLRRVNRTRREPRRHHGCGRPGQRVLASRGHFRSPVLDHVDLARRHGSQRDFRGRAGFIRHTGDGHSRAHVRLRRNVSLPLHDTLHEFLVGYGGFGNDQLTSPC
jgi:hypothetical protein